MKYLSESAPGYVDRDEPSLEEAIQRVADGGGVSSLAHPIRLGKRNHEEEEELIGRIAGVGCVPSRCITRITRPRIQPMERISRRFN